MDFPRALTTYPDASSLSLLDALAQRIQIEPFNAVATAIFFIAILHTFAAAKVTRWAHALQAAHDRRAQSQGRPAAPSVAAEILHFFGEVEVVFGLWAIVLLALITIYKGWDVAIHYFNDGVNYTEPLFVVVIMTLAATAPVVSLAEAMLRRVAMLGRGTPAAWWIAILVFAPMLGSFITEPAAMTISALLLARQFFELQPSRRLMYATLGLLFVNVSIGGTLTHFAAPPVIMVARHWQWDSLFMLQHFGWKAVVAIAISTVLYFVLFRKELQALGTPESLAKGNRAIVATSQPPVPAWVTAVHIAFMVWTVAVAHYPALFIGSFLIFLGFARATAMHQGTIELRTPLLVGFFLAGLVIHGGLQGWWIQPILSRLSEVPLFIGATILTGFNDNALITYLSTLVPDFSDQLKMAVLAGAVTGGGLTVIANAPNPAGQSLLSKYFDGAVSPVGLFLGALVPTLVAAIAFLVT